MQAETHTGVGNKMMHLRTGTGWSRGLDNILRGELSHWFGTRTWWVQIIIWFLSVNMIFLMVAIGGPEQGMPPREAITLFSIFMGLVGPIGSTIVMQNIILGERNSGTAAWVLSKPVSRYAFILSKFIGNVVGIILTMLLAQGLIAYLISALVLHIQFPILGLLAALGVHLANIFFYMTLTLLLGTFFSHGAPVIGIPLAFLFSQNFIANISPQLLKYMPYTLAIPLNDPTQLPLATALITGSRLPTLAPLFVALGGSLLFFVLALWIFQRQEL